MKILCKLDELPLLSQGEVGRHLGTGSFAKVWEFQVPLESARFALKLFQPSGHNVHDQLSLHKKFFIEESNLCAQAEHRSLVRSHGLVLVDPSLPGLKGLNKPALGMVLELCDGGSIRDVLLREAVGLGRREVSDEQALQWMVDAAEGLRFLHACHPAVIHRDIKADNVLLKSDAAEGRKVAKVADLGLHVRLQDDRSVMLRHRRSGNLAACPADFIAVASSASIQALAAESLHASTIELHEVLETPFAAMLRLNNEAAARQPLSEDQSNAQDNLDQAQVDGVEQLPANEKPTGARKRGPAPAGPPSAQRSTSAAGPRTNAVEAFPPPLRNVADSPQGAAHPPAPLPATTPPQPTCPLSPALKGGGMAVAAGFAMAGPTTFLRRSSNKGAPSSRPSSCVGVSAPLLAILPEEGVQELLGRPGAGSQKGMNMSSNSSPLHMVASGLSNRPATSDGMRSAAAQTGGIAGHAGVSVPLPVIGARYLPSDDAVHDSGCGTSASEGDWSAHYMETLEVVDNSEDRSFRRRSQGNGCGSLSRNGMDNGTGDGEGKEEPEAKGSMGGTWTELQAPSALVCGRQNPRAASSSSDRNSPGPLQPQLHPRSLVPHTRKPAKQGGEPGTRGRQPPHHHIGSGARIGKSRLARSQKTRGSDSRTSQWRATSPPDKPGAAATTLAHADGHCCDASPAASAPLSPVFPVFGIELDSEKDMWQYMRRHSSMARLLNAAGKKLPAPEACDWVYGLTGKAGSFLYMAPEVYSGLPYNEKCDVFSFGVMLYEVWSHSLLSVSFLGSRAAMQAAVFTYHDFARRVSKGFRPPRPSHLTDAQWSLVRRCWHQDPCERPDMGEVVEQLKDMLKGLRQQQQQLLQQEQAKKDRVRDLAQGQDVAAVSCGCGPQGCTIC